MQPVARDKPIVSDAVDHLPVIENRAARRLFYSLGQVRDLNSAIFKILPIFSNLFNNNSGNI
jgi:hypothetical protein